MSDYRRFGLLNVVTGNAYIESDCICFDVFWVDEDGVGCSENVLVCKNEDVGKFSISRMDTCVPPGSTDTIVSNLEALRVEKPGLFCVIIDKLKTINHEIALEALSLMENRKM